jgi:rhodanese-related sulfurtransferase
VKPVPIPISRDRLQELLRDGAQLVEVLPENEYDYEHLPRAFNIPLKTLDAMSVSALDRKRPVIVYCYDSQ